MSVSPDTSLIVLDIGLGFQVELTLDEAVRFIADKEQHMERSATQIISTAFRLYTTCHHSTDASHCLSCDCVTTWPDE
jgi:prefoldin subunit 5